MEQIFSKNKRIFRSIFPKMGDSCGQIFQKHGGGTLPLLPRSRCHWKQNEVIIHNNHRLILRNVDCWAAGNFEEKRILSSNRTTAFLIFIERNYAYLSASFFYLFTILFKEAIGQLKKSKLSQWNTYIKKLKKMHSWIYGNWSFTSRTCSTVYWICSSMKRIFLSLEECIPGHSTVLWNGFFPAREKSETSGVHTSVVLQKFLKRMYKYIR